MDFRKAVMTLLALGLTSVACAGEFMPAPGCTNNPLTVPCEHSGWDIGFTGYWLQPSSELFALDRDLTFGNDLLTLQFFNHDYEHRFGFGLEGSFHFGTGNDITVSWLRYHRSFDIHLLIPDRDDSTIEDRFEFDAVNAELAQQINVGPNWGLRAYGGVQYMRLDFNRLRHSTIPSFRSFRSVALERSEFQGAGPRVGLDGAYIVNDSFRLVARGALSILMGEKRNRFSDENFLNDVPLGEDTQDSGEYHGQPVVGLDPKVGVAFTHATTHGTVILEGGYAAAFFKNPILHSNGDTEFFHLPFGLGGAYATAKYIS